MSNNSQPTLSPMVQKFINEVTKKYSPKFVIKDKTHKTGLYAVASFFAKIFSPEIDSRYLTQVLNECWLPPHILSYSDADFIQTLAHETMHERDRQEWSSLGAFLLYGTPQILAMFSLLSFLALGFGLGWLACLGFLVFLLPIPAPGRMWMELRAYRVNMLFIRHVYHAPKEHLEAMALHYSKQFTESSYYFMWPFKNHIISLLLEEKPHPFYDEVKTWLEANNFIQ